MNLDELRVHHLDLLKKFIIRYNFDSDLYKLQTIETYPGKLKFISLFLYFLPRNWTIARLISPPQLEIRANGQDWPISAESMIGLHRMNQLHEALDTVRTEEIPGDIVETGIWRGGAVIFAASYLTLYSMADRKVIGCDSFEGLPAPDDRYPIDKKDIHSTIDVLKVSLEQVTENLRKYQLDMTKVLLVKGWFKDTLPTLNTNEIAILRLDGDMYSSTIEALNSLYEKVAPGGFVIIDDYCLEGAKKVVEDFFEGNYPKMVEIDGTGAYFRKQKD